MTLTPIPAGISLVIPVWRDHEALQNLLQRCGMLPVTEIIVVDGEHNCGHKRLCREHGAIYLTGPRCRGSQLNRGAGEARGAVLWFLHADAEPQPRAVAGIEQAIRKGAAGGYLRFRFQGRRGLGQRILEGAINLRCRAGIPYGDQGLFCTVQAFRDTGGFAEQPLFEEVALVRNLRRTGRFVCAGDGLEVSPRRWQQDGWIRRTLHNRLLACAYALGVPATTLHHWYTGYRIKNTTTA